MRNIWTLFKREMASYFYSPIGYIVAASFLAVVGGSFIFIISSLSESPSDYTPMRFFFNGIFSWIVLLVVVPVITMRLFADEKKTGTIEALMTTPLRDIEYVLAKFFSACAFYIVLWLPTVNCIFVLRHFSRDTTPLDMGPVWGGYIGMLLIGMLLISMGCMASAATRNQIVAAVVSFALSCTLFLVGIFYFLNISGGFREVFEGMSMLVHLDEMSRGVIDWRYVVFYLSGTFFFLFVTHRMVQSRQWKN